MFFILSKIVSFLLMPLTLVIICLLAGWIIKKPILKKRFLIAGSVLLIFFTNDFIINEIMNVWEIPPTPISDLPDYDVAIVLTGITNTEKPPHDRVHFIKGADRLMHTVQLYKQQKVKKILVTGGSGSLMGNEIKEADELKRVLLLCEVPEKDIIIESQSRNTRENAAFSAIILKEKFKGGKYLLVTSAFHLRRAQACFKKESIEADSFSTDFNSLPRRFSPDSFLIPSVQALMNWTILFKELLGMLFYKVVGYI